MENDGLNRLITTCNADRLLKRPVVTAHTYPYQHNGHGFKGAIPRVTRLPVWCVCVGGGGDAAACATPNDTPPQHRTAARARCVVGIQDGGGGGGVCAIIYFNYYLWL